jgi:hypothetical protein
MIQVVLTLDPETNRLVCESPLSAGDTCLLLERARLSLVQATNRPREPGVSVPTPQLIQQLLDLGAQAKKGG